MLIGMVGTTIAPWMQFYLQAAVVEKGITAKEYAESRIEVIVGCVMTSVIAFFIIVACAGAIYSVRPRDINDAAEAALGLKPFGAVRVPAVQRGAVQRLDFRRLHSAALHGVFGLRGPGLRIGREQADARGADLLLPVHAADRGGRGRGADSRVPAGAR